MRQDHRLTDALRREEQDSTVRFKQITGTETDEDLGVIDTTNVNTKMDDGESSTSDPDFLSLKRAQKPMRLEKIMLELPTKDFMKETARLYDQLKLSQRTATSLYMLR